MPIHMFKSTHRFKVMVDVSSYPVVYESVPLAIIGGERSTCPPVLECAWLGGGGAVGVGEQ